MRISLPAATEFVWEVDLMEDATAELPVAQGVVCFDLGPFEIKTLRFTLPVPAAGEDD